MPGRFSRRAGTALLLFALASPALAETMADVAALAGPDRLRIIIEGAKRENALTLYSSATTEDMGPIIASFEQRYGIGVKTWRGSSEDVRNRGITEARGARHDADVFETAGPDLEAMQAEGLMLEMKSPTLADLTPLAIRPGGQWVASRMSPYVAGYNTNLVSAADAPASYEDLTDPRWKGKLGIEAEDAGWFMTVSEIMGEAKAANLFRRIVRTNGVSVRKGHTLLANLVVSGEVPLALTIYGYKADQLLHAGAPFMPLPLAPLVALPTGIAVARAAPHPFAAALFWEHFLTEGQKILLARDNLPVNMKVKPPPAGLALLDPVKLLAEGDKWNRVFREIFSGQAR
jgi:iron(III) transport system substrate-binding protein